MTHLALSTQALLTCNTKYQWLTLHCQLCAPLWLLCILFILHVHSSQGPQTCAQTVGITRKQVGSGHVGFTGIHTASKHDHSVSHICVTNGQFVVKFHTRICIEALTKSIVHYELVRALCEEAMVCVLGSIPQFLKDLRKTGLHNWSRSTLRLSQAVCM